MLIQEHSHLRIRKSVEGRHELNDGHRVSCRGHRRHAVCHARCNKKSCLVAAGWIADEELKSDDQI